MTRREKTEFILEQVALCIERGDWTQATILGRMVNRRYFARKPKKTPEQLEQQKKEAEEREKTRAPDEAPMEIDDDVTDLKLRYFEQQTILANHEHKYLDVCKHYREVLDTESVENNPEQLRAVSINYSSPTSFHGILVTHKASRSLRGSFTILSCLRMTMNNQIFCTAFSKIAASLRFPMKSVWLSCLRSPN